MSNPSVEQAFLNILKACLSSNNSIRKPAEVQLKSIRQTNYEDILCNCSNFFKDETQDKHVRQLCSTIIKNYLTDFQGKTQWNECSSNTKNLLKGNSLFGLGSEFSEIRRASATIVAAIAKTEVANSNWPNWISVLNTAVGYDNWNYKISAIITLGEVCDEVDPEDFCQGDQETIINILKTHLFINDLEVLKHVWISFRKSVKYFQWFINDAKFKQEIYGRFCEIIIDNEKKFNWETKKISINCLTELTRKYYLMTVNEIDIIIPFISNVIKQSNEVLSIQAYMFWISLADVEIDAIQNKTECWNICLKHHNFVWNDILYTFANYKTEAELNDEEFTAYKAASYLMERWCKCTDISFNNNVCVFMQQCFQSQEVKQQTAAIYAFTSILETRHVDEMRNIIPSCIDAWIPMLLGTNDENWQFNIATCLNKICEIHSIVLIQQQTLFHTIINWITDKIITYSNRIASELCLLIHNLAKSSKEFYNGNKWFDKYMQDLLQMLMGLAYKKGSYNVEHNVTWQAFNTYGTLIEISSEGAQSWIESSFSSVFDAFLSAGDEKNFLTKDMQYDYQAYICVIIIAYWSSHKIKWDKQKGEAIYKVVKQCFTGRGAVFDEGMLLCSSWFVTLENTFDFWISDFFVYVKYAIENYEDYAACSKAIYATSDLIRGCRQSFLPYLEQWFPFIIAISNNHEANRDLRLDTFLVYTDMLSEYPQTIPKYFTSIMQFLLVAYQYGVDIPAYDDIDSVAYTCKYNERLMECWSNLTIFIQDLNLTKEFYCYLEKTMEYVNTSLEINPNIDISQLGEIAGWLIDLIKMYGKEMKHYLKDSNIKLIIKEWKADKSSSFNELANMLHQSVFNCKITQ